MNQNTIIGSNGDYGIHISNLSAPTVYSNIIQGFQTGIRAESEVSNISFNGLWDNDGSFSGTGLPDLIGEVVSVNANNDPSDVYANIFLDPLLFHCILLFSQVRIPIIPGDLSSLITVPSATHA